MRLNFEVRPPPAPTAATALMLFDAQWNAARGVCGLLVHVELDRDSFREQRAAYSFFGADLRNAPGINNPANVEAQEDSSPRHQGYVQSVVTLGPRLELQQTFRAVSGLPGQEVPRYQALDLTGVVQLVRTVELAAGVHNLLDINHPEFGGTPGGVGIRRSVYVRLVWRP